jgi:hypothetical protein
MYLNGGGGQNTKYLISKIIMFVFLRPFHFYRYINGAAPNKTQNRYPQSVIYFSTMQVFVCLREKVFLIVIVFRFASYEQFFNKK